MDKWAMLLRRTQAAHGPSGACGPFQRSALRELSTWQPRRAGAPGDSTPQEKAAVLARWCAELGFNRTLDRLPVLSLAELRPEAATEFFLALETALGDLRRAGMDRTSADLNRVGQIVAGGLQRWDVEARLSRQGDRWAAARLADLPFLPHRGR